MYFKQFPSVLIDVNTTTGFRSSTKSLLMSDITKNVRFKKEVIDNIVLYDFHDLKDNETMEMVSEKYYESPEYHWVLMLLNNIYDVTTDMPKSAEVFEQYLEEKYSDTYIGETYGGDIRSLVVDIVNSNGSSVSIEGDFQFKNRTTLVNTLIEDVMSVLSYDSTLGMDVIRYIRKSDASFVDTTTSFLDFSLTTLYSPVYLYDYEFAKNESRRRIKVISPEILSLVVKNFRELIK